MKLSKLQELYDLLDKRAVLQHFVDAPIDSLFIGMKGVNNQIVLLKELDMKVRILLGIQVDKIEEEMKAAGIDMTPEKKEKKEKKEPESESKTPSETPPEKVIDATASESGEESEASGTPEESPGADEEGSTE